MLQKIQSLQRQLERLKSQRDELEREHKGKEMSFTYHGGFSLGYIKGKITIIEDLIDDLGLMLLKNPNL